MEERPAFSSRYGIDPSGDAILRVSIKVYEKGSDLEKLFKFRQMQQKERARKKKIKLRASDGAAKRKSERKRGNSPMTPKRGGKIRAGASNNSRHSLMDDDNDWSDDGSGSNDSDESSNNSHNDDGTYDTFDSYVSGDRSYDEVDDECTRGTFETEDTEWTGTQGGSVRTSGDFTGGSNSKVEEGEMVRRNRRRKKSRKKKKRREQFLCDDYSDENDDSVPDEYSTILEARLFGRHLKVPACRMEIMSDGDDSDDDSEEGSDASSKTPKKKGMREIFNTLVGRCSAPTIEQHDIDSDGNEDENEDGNKEANIDIIKEKIESALADSSSSPKGVADIDDAGSGKQVGIEQKRSITKTESDSNKSEENVMPKSRTKVKKEDLSVTKRKPTIAKTIAGALSCQGAPLPPDEYDLEYPDDGILPSHHPIIVAQKSQDFTLGELTMNTHERDIESEREAFLKSQAPLREKHSAARELLPIAFGGDGMCTMMSNRPLTIEGQGRSPILDTVYTSNSALEDISIEEDYFIEYKTPIVKQGGDSDLEKQEENPDEQEPDRSFNEEDLVITDGTLLSPDESKQYVEIGNEISDMDDMRGILNHPIADLGKE